MDGLKETVEFGVIGLLCLLSVVDGRACRAVAILPRVPVADFEGIQGLEMTLTQCLVVIGNRGRKRSPYIGLLGTVLGMILTFHTMDTSQAMAVTTIMVGLSLA
jgi:biopolymer transport protein ExbB